MIRIGGSTRLTTSAAKTVMDEGSNAIRRSVIQRRRGAHAASVPSDFPKRPKTGKKVPVDERRVMVKSYVNKYREAHAGKFPSITDTCKEVGGSFYVVRKIIQELEHKSKVVPSISEREIQGPKKPAKESESFAGVKNTSRVDPHIGDASENFVEVEAGLQTSKKMLSEEVIETKVRENSDLARTQPNLMEGDTEGTHHRLPEKSDEVKETQSDNSNFVIANENLLKMEADDQHSERPEILKNVSHSKEADDQHSERPEILKNISHSYAESTGEDKKEHLVSGDVVGPDNPKYKYVQHISHRQTNETEPQKESAIWRNLKSFADGIINIWRKL